MGSSSTEAALAEFKPSSPVPCCGYKEGPVQLEMRLLQLLPLLASLATVHGALAADSMLIEDTEVGKK